MSSRKYPVEKYDRVEVDDNLYALLGMEAKPLCVHDIVIVMLLCVVRGDYSFFENGLTYC